MLATALIMALAFGCIYFVVQETMYSNIDDDLSYEAKKHTNEIYFVADSVKIINKKEWEEREHREVQVNPVFIQLLDKEGNFMDKSPNLKENVLVFRKEVKFGGHFNASLNKRGIRQIQLPIEHQGTIKGFIVAAMSLEASKMVLLNLRNVLLFSYVVLLAILYFISRYLAGKNSTPIVAITETTNRITKNNLSERVTLPIPKDELYFLSASINELLQRIENAIERERQFTSDASHELRTPLASLRGTLEVLLRKPRTPLEYETKIKQGLVEIDRMTATLEQLLLLARMDSTSSHRHSVVAPLPQIVDDILCRYKAEISAKALKINMKTDEGIVPKVTYYYTNLIIDNILNNAIKYSDTNGNIDVRITQVGTKVKCTIKDEGIGISKENLGAVFNRFFRSDALQHKDIPGNGLGLAIAKKAADAIDAKIEVESTEHVGTIFSITILSES